MQFYSGTARQLSLLGLHYFDISENQLSGNLDTLRNLTLLKHLAIGANSFNGTLDAVVGNLTSLEFLNVSFNQLHGDIPSVLGQSKNLTTLDLSHNQLQGT